MYLFNSHTTAYAEQMISKHPFIHSFRKGFVVVYRKILSRSAMKLSRSAYAFVYCMKKNIHVQLSLPILRVH